MRTTLRYRILLLGATAALLISACGTSGGKDDANKKPKKPTTTEVTEPSTTEPSTTEPSTTEPDTTGPDTSDTTEPDTTDTTEPGTTDTTEPGTTTPNGEARKRAEAANITADDFPTGWTGSPASSSAPDKTFETCAPELHIEDVTVARVNSDRFHQGTGSGSAQVTSVSRVVDSEGSARQVLETFGKASFVRCLDTELKKATSASVKGSLEPSSGKKSYGDESAGISGSFSGKNPSGKTVTFEIGLVAIRTGDIVTILTAAVANGSDFGSLFDDLATSIADRQQG